MGYQQGHDAGHQFWNIHYPGARRYKSEWHQTHGDPLLQVYEKIDQGIGEIISTAGVEADAVIVTGLSMIEKRSCNSILDELLWKLENLMYPGAGISAKSPRQERRFFSVSHNAISGAIRLNLKDRESSGVVPRENYDQVLDELEERFQAIINPASGKSIVDMLIRTHRNYPGAKVDHLPDVFLVWDRSASLTRVSSPWFEEIAVRSKNILDFRTGDHESKATVHSTFRLSQENTIPVESLAGQLETYLLH